MAITTDLKEKILTRIRTRRRGGVYINKDFLDLGSRAAVDQALSRLVRAGAIRRLGRGLFDYPGAASMRQADRIPDPLRIAEAVARKRGGRARRSGAFVAGELGLSAGKSQKPLYVTDSTPASVRVGNLSLTLRRVAPGMLPRRGRAASGVIQALESLGRDGLNEAVIARLRAALPERDKAKLLRDSRYAPGWVAEAARRIVRDE